MPREYQGLELNAVDNKDEQQSLLGSCKSAGLLLSPLTVTSGGTTRYGLRAVITPSGTFGSSALERLCEVLSSRQGNTFTQTRRSA